MVFEGLLEPMIATSPLVGKTMITNGEPLTTKDTLEEIRVSKSRVHLKVFPSRRLASPLLSLQQHLHIRCVVQSKYGFGEAVRTCKAIEQHIMQTMT